MHRACACVREKCLKVLMRKPDRKRLLGKRGSRWQDNIKINPKIRWMLTEFVWVQCRGQYLCVP